MCRALELRTTYPPFSYTPWCFAQIMGVTSVYTVNNQQKVRSMIAMISIFKNWMQWGDIILHALQPSNFKSTFKSVNVLTNYFQHTMNNS